MCQDTAVNKCPCPLRSYFVGGYGKYISKRVRSKLRRKKKKGSIRKIMIFQKSAKTSLIRWHLLWTWEWGRQLCRYLGKDRNRAKTLSGMCSLRRGRRGLSMAWVVWASKSRWEMRPSVEMGLGGESGAYPVGLHASQLQARHPIKCLT